jgi:2-oxoglutarate ferredoxin oxidoreductase subunit gamma
LGKIHKVCFAGFGGQGVMSMGQLLAYAGMIEGKHVTWCPSYGPEMRGGTANCSVIVSEKPIATPVVNSKGTAVVIMNEASFDKFIDLAATSESIYINSSLVKRKVERTDVNVYYIPVNEIASKLGNPKLINIIMLGALIEKEKTVAPESIIEAFKKVFGPSKEKLIPLNLQALKKGADEVKLDRQKSIHSVSF